MWPNKLLEIETLIQWRKPDLCFISEANLWNNVDMDQLSIPGYSLILLNTMDLLSHARIVLLVRNNLNVKKS